MELNLIRFLKKLLMEYWIRNKLALVNLIQFINLRFLHFLKLILTYLSHFDDSFIFIFIFLLNFLSMYPLVARSTDYDDIFMIGPSHSTIPVVIANMVIVCRREVFKLFAGIAEKHIVGDMESFFLPFPTPTL